MSRATVRPQGYAGDVRSKVARVGLLGQGALYVLLGFLSIKVAMGENSSASASKSGAIQTVAQAPFGKFLLIALTVALIALVVWKFSQAVSGDPIEGSDGSHRAKYAGKGVLYSGAALASLSILIANWGGDAGAVPGGGGGEGQQHAAGVVMGMPGGRWIVLLVGLVAIGFGGYEIYKHAINRGFMKRTGALSPDKRKVIEALGRAGYLGTGLVAIGVGVFFVIAGLTFDPKNAKGLSGLLAELAGQSWGQVVLWLIAVGLFAHGLFSFAEARYRPAT
ncbi:MULTISPECIES: DUF1206 domain-containing protein [Mycobacterium]|uniref:DUF1206 domain-containing protein n=1 Tax=Mycobacterium TaxID=1763 RepID=UPI0009F1C044|nr:MULTISPECIES: DUF1206 domain-containing protein [Mycobacterium]MBI2698732.1 DUF1206 domain-containing protein [Mycobacterium sp.]PJE14601.1 MAG: DUF1206 domain-containing protein [Mycobacterium sp.]